MTTSNNTNSIGINALFVYVHDVMLSPTFHSLSYFTSHKRIGASFGQDMHDPIIDKTSIASLRVEAIIARSAAQLSGETIAYLCSPSDCSSRLRNT